jgi:hypothetical protein
MRRTSTRALGVVALLSAIAMTPGQVPAGAAAAPVTISGKATGTDTFVLVGGCAIAHVTGKGKVNASVPTTYRIDGCVDRPTPVGSGILPVHGKISIYRPLGVIRGTYSGKVTSLTSTTMSDSYTVKVTGGTLKFAHATGSLTIRGKSYFPPDTPQNDIRDTLQFNGTVQP